MMAKLAIISNDAGGSELISSWIKYQDLDFIFSLDGPAVDIFNRKLGKIKNLPIDIAIDASKTVITGTGWLSNHEYDGIVYSKNKNKKVISFLDHWVNYEERFIRDNLKVLPDELWVSDNYAFDIAKKIFPNEHIKLVHNYYMDDIVRDIKNIDEVDGDQLLYILEPIRDNWEKDQPGEFQALDYFIHMLPKLNLPKNLKIKLRLHPSENKKKYNDWIKSQCNIRLSIDDEKFLKKSISDSKWIAGCESFALTIALNAKRKVFCTLPPWSHNCRLPYDEIINLSEIN